jgi:hypothetical protein
LQNGHLSFLALFRHFISLFISISVSIIIVFYSSPAPNGAPPEGVPASTRGLEKDGL